MFEHILVVTDRHDFAEAPIRHQSARERRFLARLRGIALELLFPTGPTTFEDDAVTDEVEIQTENATRHAIDLCRIHRARLHVLFTVDSVRYDTSMEFARQPLVEEGEETVERLVDAAERVGLEVTETVSVGRPAELILGYVADHDVDLVVMNARRTGSRWARLRGDLVSTVIGRASVPVYAIPRQPGHPD